MGGGLLQLVAYGAQDAYLSGNPQITFWKGLYKRHTNFAMEPFRINMTGQANWGVKHSATIGRHADLLYSTYLEVVLPYGVSFNNDQSRLGYNLIRYAELEIGGQLIDRLYGEWLFLWDCLTSDVATGVKLSRMVGGNVSYASSTVSFSAPAGCSAGGSGREGLPPSIVYVPLSFFYTRNPGAALPLIALQYHEVKINILWSDPTLVSGTAASSVTAPTQAALYIDYIYLDVDERRRMAQQSHEYLIEQTQFNEDKGISSANNRVDLTFNHPVKELVWVVQPESYTNCKLNGAGTRLKPFTYDQAAVYQQWLQINGQDRLDRRYGDYFNKVQPYQHHTGSFDAIKITANYVYVGNNAGAGGALSLQNGAYMYSFALRPEEHQPSGTCNFSRIDTATLVMEISGAVTINDATDNTWNVRVYAVNYNVLRIMSGMAGLAYSN
jgi:hypothetical protein